MKVIELIEWLQKLNPEYEIVRHDSNLDVQEITSIDAYEANREYVIY